MEQLFEIPRKEIWVRVGNYSDIVARKITKIQIENRWISFHLWQGRVYAIDDSCPHRGASLADGDVDKDGYLSCSLHGWEYKLSTGEGRGEFAGCVAVFPVREKNGVIFVLPKRLFSD